MKLVFVMPLWKRHTLTALVLRQWHRQIHRLRGTVHVHLVCIGSEGRTSARLLEGYGDGMSYVEAPNEPLNQKWNKGLDVARHLEPDAVLIIGSDDLVSDSLMLRYSELLSGGHDFFGLRDLYFFDPSRLKLGYWPGYGTMRQPLRAGEPVGAARCHSRRAMEAVHWKLWPTDVAQNRVLDLTSRDRLAAAGFTPTAFTLDELGAKAVDIKADESITAFDRIPYDWVTRGTTALEFLRDLVDADGLQTLHTHWRTAA